MALRTALYDWHASHGGRLVDFAGWDMPVQYSSIVEEHTAVRTGCGLFDVSHMGRLSLTGPDALALVDHVFTNSAATMREGQVRYGLVCNPAGGVLDDILVYRWPDGWGLVVNASNRDRILHWLTDHAAGRDVALRDHTRDTAMIAVQGPQAFARFAGLTEDDPAALKYYHALKTRYRGRPCVVSRTGYTGEDGLEIVTDADQAGAVWDELVARGGRPCGLGARDTLRLEAGMPLYGHELGEDIDPLQAGLAWAVKLDKGDFIGREALLRRRGDPTLRRRVGLELEGRRIAREGAGVTQSGREVGRVTSGTFSPTLQRVLAMAYVDPPAIPPGTSLEVDIRGQPAAARVVGLPFYRRPR